MLNWSKRLSDWNRARKAKYPSKFVSKKRYEELLLNYELLTAEAAENFKDFSAQANLHEIQPFVHWKAFSEVCLFVSYCPSPMVKPHVKRHIQALQRVGIGVILIINADQLNTDFSTFSVSGLELQGLYLRENKGFDFGAWSHLFATVEELRSLKRLYLVNDSIIGPLSQLSFDQQIMSIRESKEALIGLTFNDVPRLHLQSFFLCLSQDLLKDVRFVTYFSALLNLPTKKLVIDVYESRLTSFVTSLGYRCKALLNNPQQAGEQNVYDPRQLNDFISRGLTYVKVSAFQNEKVRSLLEKNELVDKNLIFEQNEPTNR